MTITRNVPSSEKTVVTASHGSKVVQNCQKMKLKKAGNIKRLWKTPKSNWMNVSVNIRKEDFSNDHP